ncbi:hypothetical protein [Treponema sp.]|uniref:hypothetical protein n=1 Tax=Treponema sp. TaxID=166 RepID=UPI00388FE2DF
MKKLYLIFMAAITMFAVMSCANPAGDGGVDNFLPEQPRWSSIEEYAETHTIDMRGHNSNENAYELGSNVKILVQKDTDMYFLQAIVKSHMKDESVLFFDPYGEENYFIKSNEQELILYTQPKSSVYYYFRNELTERNSSSSNNYKQYYEQYTLSSSITLFEVTYTKSTDQ